MKLTKFDYIQIAFNLMIIAATALNLLFLLGKLPRFVTFVSLIVAVVGCLMTNIGTGTKRAGLREEVSGLKFLAGLSYLTGALWVLSYAASVFLPIGMAG